MATSQSPPPGSSSTTEAEGASTAGGERRRRPPPRLPRPPPGAPLVWARDGDGRSAAEHPAHLLPFPLDDAIDDDDDDGNDGEEFVWVRWASNGTAARIPKRRVSSEGLSPRRRRRRPGGACGDGGGGDDDGTASRPADLAVARGAAEASEPGSNGGPDSGPDDGGGGARSTERPKKKQRRSRLSLTREQRRRSRERSGERRGSERGGGRGAGKEAGEETEAKAEAEAKRPPPSLACVAAKAARVSLDPPGGVGEEQGGDSTKGGTSEDGSKGGSKGDNPSTRKGHAKGDPEREEAPPPQGLFDPPPAVRRPEAAAVDDGGEDEVQEQEKTEAEKNKGGSDRRNIGPAREKVPPPPRSEVVVIDDDSDEDEDRADQKQEQEKNEAGGDGRNIARMIAPSASHPRRRDDRTATATASSRGASSSDETSRRGAAPAGKRGAEVRGGTSLKPPPPPSPSPSSSIPPPHTHRSSAYIQHLAEVCHVLSTDGRWRTSARSSTSGRRTTERLFAWEEGDDLSAVLAYASLYDGPYRGEDGSRTGAAEADDGTDEGTTDEVFERAMHLYGRTFVRRGPWFDLADLYARYYAPKGTRTVVPEDEDDGSAGVLAAAAPGRGDRDGDGDGEGRADQPIDAEERFRRKPAPEKKLGMFFAPRPSLKVGGARSDSQKGQGFDDELFPHRKALEDLFRDVLRLRSMGLLRTFRSERECGSVAGDVSYDGRRRGGLLSAEERRDVLHRLGGHRPARGARGASTALSGDGEGSERIRNKILDQMRGQRSVVASFANTATAASRGCGSDAGESALLPVVKHVEFVLLRKLATKVASLVFAAPNKTEVEAARGAIDRAWAAARARHRDDLCDPAGGVDGHNLTCAVRPREAPLKTLRRAVRLFLCAGGGPGAMRGDGTNGWISVLDDGERGDAGFGSGWHNVSHPGLSSRLGLEHYELSRCYSPIPSSASSEAANPAANVFARRSEFHLWEIGAELRSFVDRCAEAYEAEKVARRRFEKESSKNRHEGDLVERRSAHCGGKAAGLRLLGYDGSALLTEEGRKRVTKEILISCFEEGVLLKHSALDSAMSELNPQIENDVLSLSGDGDANEGEDCFVSDVERMIAATAIVCHRVLSFRLRYPSPMTTTLSQRPWLRHLTFDAILSYILWDCVPVLERRGHHSMAVSLLQTMLFGRALCQTRPSGGEYDESFWIYGPGSLGEVEPFVKCLLARRNRGKCYERLIIDLTHVERRLRKETRAKPTKKAKKSGLSHIQMMCEALLRHEEKLGTIPFCSLRNLSRRSKAPLPQTRERSILNIRPDGEDLGWSPKTDSAVANAITSDSDDSAVGKRCSFVGWEMQVGQAEGVEPRRSLNVEELAMEEYHFGRLPSDVETAGGRWVGWHDEGGHVRALFRIICLPPLLGCHPKHECCLDEQATVFITPYQRSPHDLHVGHFSVGDIQSGSPIGGFYQRRLPEIESFLSKLMEMEPHAAGDLVYEAVKKRWDSHADDHSRQKDPRLIKDVMELRTLCMIAGALGTTALASIFRTLYFDYRHWTGGLPDLLLVRARYDSDSKQSSPDAFVDLADWIGEEFSKARIDEENLRSHINMLMDRDDEFLGCSKNADGCTAQQQKFSRKKPGHSRVEVPVFPDRLEFLHEDTRVEAECLFVEVKSSNDRLSERQEDWLSILENCTNARVCKFTSSPNKK